MVGPYSHTATLARADGPLSLYKDGQLPLHPAVQFHTLNTACLAPEGLNLQRQS